MRVGKLLSAQQAVRRLEVVPLREVAMIAQVLVERHLLAALAPSPPALAVARLIDDDAVDPGAEGGLAAKAVDGAEDPQEDLLRQVQRFVVIAQQVQRQLVDHALMLAHELRAGVFVACGTALNQAGFTPVDISPCDGSKRLHGETLCHLTPTANTLRWHPFHP